MISLTLEERAEGLRQVTYIVYRKSDQTAQFITAGADGLETDTVKWGVDDKYTVQDGDISTVVEVMERITGGRFLDDTSYKHKELVRYVRST